MNRFPAILFVMQLAACNAALGLDERPERETSTASGGGTAGAGGVSSCARACEEDVPSGWSGPTAVQTGDGAPACDAPELTNVELTLHDEALPAPAECECACDDAVGVDCSTSQVQVRTYDDNNCANPRDVGSGVVNECVRLCCGGDSANYVKPTPDVSAASCAAIALADSKPAPAWGSHLVGCGPVQNTDCEARSCYAPPAEGTLCIYRSGEHACPEGPFSERRVWYAGHEDTRGCEPCACGAVDSSDCNEVVVGYSIDICINDEAAIVPEPGCTTAPLDFDSARIVSVAPTGSCTPTGGNPIGGVSPTQPTTVCCLP